MRVYRRLAWALLLSASAVAGLLAPLSADAALSLFWRAEGTTLDGTHDYSAGDTAVDTSGSPTISATGAKVGSNGISGAGYYYFDNTTPSAIINTGEGVIAGWFHATTWGNLTAPIYLRGSSYQNAVKIAITGTSGSGNVALYINEDTGASTLATTGANLSTGNWYFVIVQWDNGGTGPRRRIAVYNASGTLIAENSSTAAFTSPPDLQTLRFGSIDGFAGYVDNIFGATDYDDASAILSNRDITSYTSYGGGGGLPTITDAEDEAFYGGELGVTLTGSNFGSTQGAGRVVISPTDDIDNVSAVEQTVTSWSASSIDFTVVRSSLSLNTNLYLFVEENGGNSNAAGYVVQITGDKKIKLLLNSASVGATVDGVVFEAPVSGIVGPEVCEFTGQTVAAGSGADAGKGVLKVVTATFGCNALALGAAPLVYVKNATNFTPIWAASVIAE